MKYIGYARVSTHKQEISGNGLAAQEKAISDYVKANGGELVSIYVEAESGKRDDRPELAKAIRHADLIGARVIVGKLDRLSRSLHFLLTLQKANVDFCVADMPHCDKFTVSIYGALAEREREMIVDRTIAGMQAAKAKGAVFGTPENLNAGAAAKGRKMGRLKQAEKAALFAAKVLPDILKLQAKGLSLNAIASKMNERGILTARGNKGNWSAQAVKNILARS
jgi:DNA invertase Pin-like site-specific DNA recombinase